MNPELITVLRFGDDSQVVEWFQALRETQDETNGDGTAFVERLRERAGDFDHAMVEEFLRTLEGGDIEQSVRELLDLQPQMPGLYWSYHPKTGATNGDTGGPFAWVTAAHQAQLAGAWGNDWQSPLGQQLDYRWGADWQANPTEHKQAWLDTLMPELLAPSGQQQSAPVTEDPYAWVPEASRQRMTTAWGNDWATYLGQQLDYRWGTDWQGNPTEHKQAWLEALLPELLPDTTAAPGNAAQTADPAADVAAPPLPAQAVAAVEQAVNEVLADELAKLGEGNEDLSAEDLEEIMAEVRDVLLGKSTD